MTKHRTIISTTAGDTYLIPGWRRIRSAPLYSWYHTDWPKSAARQLADTLARHGGCHVPARALARYNESL